LAASSTSPSKVPGKEEFYETLRYYDRQLKLRGVKLSLNTRVSAETLARLGALTTSCWPPV
jgi:hypothetical protein